MEFVTIAGLASFCAIQNHGFDILCSFSTIVQFTPLPPFGWRFWKAGLNKSVLLSVYALISRGIEYDNSLPGIIAMQSIHTKRIGLLLPGSFAYNFIFYCISIYGVPKGLF